MANFFKDKLTINCGGHLVNLSQPAVMGIMNITPDSFYSASRTQSEEAVITRALQIATEGGSIVDIGGYSSRPGADHVPEDEEYSRLRYAVALVRKHIPHMILSIDTFRAGVVAKLYDQFGAFIVNDISSGAADEAMISTVARLKLPYIAMHMRGTPQTMAANTLYDDVVAEVINYLAAKVMQLGSVGVIDIIVDPGFGFAKTLEGNYELLARLSDFKVLELPLLAGLSRKSMLYKLLNTSPDNVSAATTAANMAALERGARILRVHDVKEAVQAVAVWSAINNSLANK